MLFRLDLQERRAELCAIEVGTHARSMAGHPAGVRHDWGPGESRRVICSVATGRDLAWAGFSLSTVDRYARRHRWDVEVDWSRHPLAGTPGQRQLQMLARMLRVYDVVLWVNPDVVVLDDVIDIGSLVTPEADIYVTEPFAGLAACPRLDVGVLVLRSTEQVRRLIDAILENGDLLGPALLRELERRAASARVVWLERCWDSMPTGARCLRPRFVHFAGMPDEHRKRAVLAAAADAFSGVSGDPLDDVPTRRELPRLLNRMGLIGTGAEVGVRNGDFSAWILHRWQGYRLLSIDPWAESAQNYRDIANVSQRRHDELWTQTRVRLEAFGARSEIWRMSSARAAERIEDASLDFVYLDARHDEQSVAQDLALWFRKIVPGGIISGHDYLDGDLPQGLFGVKAAVDRFFEERRLSVRTTPEDLPWPSWLVVAPP
jgi:hypothetical protein